MKNEIMLHGFLIFIKRTGEDGSKYPVTEREVKIGTSADCRIRINTPKVSSEHCLLIVSDDGQIFVRNLSTLNPTCVNNVALSKDVFLKHNDELEIGGRLIRWEYLQGSKFYGQSKTKWQAQKKRKTISGAVVDSPLKRRKTLSPKAKKIGTPKRVSAAVLKAMTPRTPKSTTNTRKSGIFSAAGVSKPGTPRSLNMAKLLSGRKSLQATKLVFGSADTSARESMTPTKNSVRRTSTPIVVGKVGRTSKKASELITIAESNASPKSRKSRGISTPKGMKKSGVAATPGKYSTGEKSPKTPESGRKYANKATPKSAKKLTTKTPLKSTKKETTGAAPKTLRKSDSKEHGSVKNSVIKKTPKRTSSGGTTPSMRKSGVKVTPKSRNSKKLSFTVTPKSRSPKKLNIAITKENRSTNKVSTGTPKSRSPLKLSAGTPKSQSPKTLRTGTPKSESAKKISAGTPKSRSPKKPIITVTPKSRSPKKLNIAITKENRITKKVSTGIPKSPSPLKLSAGTPKSQSPKTLRTGTPKSGSPKKLSAGTSKYQSPKKPSTAVTESTRTSSGGTTRSMQKSGVKVTPKSRSPKKLNMTITPKNQSAKKRSTGTPKMGSPKKISAGTPKNRSSKKLSFPVTPRGVRKSAVKTPRKGLTPASKKETPKSTKDMKTPKATASVSGRKTTPKQLTKKKTSPGKEAKSTPTGRFSSPSKKDLGDDSMSKPNTPLKSSPLRTPVRQISATPKSPRAITPTPVKRGEKSVAAKAEIRNPAQSASPKSLQKRKSVTDNSEDVKPAKSPKKSPQAAPRSVSKTTPKGKKESSPTKKTSPRRSKVADPKAVNQGGKSRNMKNKLTGDEDEAPPKLIGRPDKNKKKALLVLGKAALVKTKPEFKLKQKIVKKAVKITSKPKNTKRRGRIVPKKELSPSEMATLEAEISEVPIVKVTPSSPQKSSSPRGSPRKGNIVDLRSLSIPPLPIPGSFGRRSSKRISYKNDRGRPDYTELSPTALGLTPRVIYNAPTKGRRSTSFTTPRNKSTTGIIRAATTSKKLERKSVSFSSSTKDNDTSLELNVITPNISRDVFVSPLGTPANKFGQRLSLLSPYKTGSRNSPQKSPPQDKFGNTPSKRVRNLFESNLINFNSPLMEESFVGVSTGVSSFPSSTDPLVFLNEEAVQDFIGTRDSTKKLSPRSAENRLSVSPTSNRNNVRKSSASPKSVQFVNDSGYKSVTRSSGSSSKVPAKSPKSDLNKLQGVIKTPKGQNSPKNLTVSGAKKLSPSKLNKSPKNDLTNVRGVKKLMKTPKPFKSPKNDLTNVRGLKKLMSTPKPQKSPKNDLTNVRGLKKLMSTPKPQKSPKNDLTNVRGLKKLMSTPKQQKSPKNDLTNVRGLKKLMSTPKPRKSPKNDLTDVRGVKRLLSSPKVIKSPKNDLTDVKGVKRLMSTPKLNKSPKNDLTNIWGLKMLMADQAGPRNNLKGLESLRSLFRNSPRNDLLDVEGIKNLFLSPERGNTATVKKESSGTNEKGTTNNRRRKRTITDKEEPMTKVTRATRNKKITESSHAEETPKKESPVRARSRSVQVKQPAKRGRSAKKVEEKSENPALNAPNETSTNDESEERLTRRRAAPRSEKKTPKSAKKAPRITAKKDEKVEKPRKGKASNKKETSPVKPPAKRGRLAAVAVETSPNSPGRITRSRAASSSTAQRPRTVKK